MLTILLRLILRFLFHRGPRPMRLSKGQFAQMLEPIEPAPRRRKAPRPENHEEFDWGLEP